MNPVECVDEADLDSRTSTVAISTQAIPRMRGIPAQARKLDSSCTTWYTEHSHAIPLHSLKSVTAASAPLSRTPLSHGVLHREGVKTPAGRTQVEETTGAPIRK